MDRIHKSYQDKIMTAQQAARMIKSGMTLGMSGFTLVGYPKAIPQALAELGHAKNLTIATGASVGDNMDGVMARAKLVSHRFPYMSNGDMRKQVNAGEMGYADMHLSHIPTFVNQRIGYHLDIAVIEAAAVTECGLIPAVSGCWSDTQVRMADKVILEVNQAIPLSVEGMHDFFEIGIPPHAKPIPILTPADRIGSPYIPCPPEKVAAIVLTDELDAAPKFRPSDPVTDAIGANVVTFLKSEIAAGRLPKTLGPIQSGVGQVANAVLKGLGASGLRGLTMYTETLQDSALELLESEVFQIASTCAVSLSSSAQEHFYQNIDFFRKRIIIRSQEISNHPEVVRRLGLVAMNTPIEVDIYGNVNSTHIMGTSVMNGIGGSGDFARNARVNIFAAASTAKGGSISCIVPMVSHVDHTEHDTQIIVTEQGVADLRWKTPTERAELLIEHCAHPDYRPMLRKYFEQAKQCSKGQHTPHDLTKALSWHQHYLESGSMR
jgi:succinyl-CoA:acetate CoA-transferase